MKKATLLAVFTFSLCFFYSCKKGDVSSSSATSSTSGNADLDLLLKTKSPSGFNYQTSQAVQLNITLLAPDNTPIPNIPVNILDKSETLGGTILYTALTDANGKITGTASLPSSLSAVVVDAQYVGIIRNAVVSVSDKSILCTIGGVSTYDGNVLPDNALANRPATNSNYAARSATSYAYMGSYDNNGKPAYLVSPNDVISSTLLADINASLPEQKSVLTNHPEYLNTGAETNINVTSQSDVWLTFVSEGADWKNSIAYFTYPTGHPPTTESAIDTLYMVFPNASFKGSGGNMSSGNKVKLGRFNAGTSIGLCLVADGWNGSNVGAGRHRVYSIDNLNPESAANLKRHCILLDDTNDQQFLIGFEDMRRDMGSDNDFNDCILSVKCNPVNGISTQNVNLLAAPNDYDGDGVEDNKDDYPQDATKAYDSYFPSKIVDGTLAFEDNWPYTGDYDMNDMVVKYNYHYVQNSQNKTVQIKATYILSAAGATFKNGFGIEFPFAANKVSSVIGSRLQPSSIVTLADNGCESGQSKAVIIPWDNAFYVANTTGWYNTYMSVPFLTPDTINMTINLAEPLLASELGNAPFNPFIFIDQTRGRECHLAGNTPTQKADVSYFKQGMDNTTPSQNIYYKTTTNLPYALGFTQSFEYPIEGRPINTAYTNFVTWAQSGGASCANWYYDTNDMVSSNIYSRQ